MRTLVCLLMLLPAAAPAESLSSNERNRAMSELHATRKRLLDAIEGLTPKQWNFKPNDVTWSVAECAEHIAVSEDSIFDLITKKIMAGPSRKDLDKGKDEEVLKVIPERDQKFKAPEFLVPTHRWPSRDALAAHFKESRDRTIEYVKTTPDDLRSHFAPHPVMKDLDAYQWILLMAAHTERHVRQIEEVKANASFPRP